MAGKDKVYPDGGGAASAPPPTGAYYSVKDQALPGPATYRRGRSRARSPCCCCFAWLCSLLGLFILILGTATLIFYLVVQPRAPKYEVDNVHITGLDVSSNFSSLTTETTFEVRARNPNKKIGIYYDEIKVNVQTMGVVIGDGSLPSFYQGHKNTTYISGDLKSEAVPVSQATQIALLTAQQAGRVPLYLQVNVKARVKIGSWKSKRFTVKVRCDMLLDLQAASQVVDKSCSVKR